MKKIKNTYNYIGDCLAYICFNSLMLADSFNMEQEKQRISVLSHMGIRVTYQSGMKVNLNNLQDTIRKYDIILIDQIYDKIRSNAPSVEPSIRDFINASLYVYIPFKRITELYIARDHILKGQDSYFNSKKYSQKDPIGFIVKRYKKKLDLLVKHEAELHNYDLVIYLGDSTDKLKTRKPILL